MDFAVAFDFIEKQIVPLAWEAVPDALARKQYCWIDIGASEPQVAMQFLETLGVESSTLDRIEHDEYHGQFYLGRSSILCTLVEANYVDDELRLNTVHVVLGEHFMATVHSRPSTLVQRVLETYEDDFHAMAESGGFMLFEVADHLISGYRATLTRLTSRVEGIQARLLGDTGDEILTDVSELTRSLLDYRSAVVTARETIHEVATRRSAFIKPSTQPYLEKQTVPLERLASDAATERTVLSESLNLYMGIISHRTNRVVNRLTIVSMIFLPLNFLAAVYGMNFEYMPELPWRFGYLAFWGVSAALVVALLIFMRRRDWI